jgi:hypothetical protein
MDYQKFKEELQIKSYKTLELKYQNLYKKNQEIENLYKLTKTELYIQYKNLFFKYQYLISKYNKLHNELYNQCDKLINNTILNFNNINKQQKNNYDKLLVNYKNLKIEYDNLTMSLVEISKNYTNYLDQQKRNKLISNIKLLTFM